MGGCVSKGCKECQSWGGLRWFSRAGFFGLRRLGEGDELTGSGDSLVDQVVVLRLQPLSLSW